MTALRKEEKQKRETSIQMTWETMFKLGRENKNHAMQSGNQTDGYYTFLGPGRRIHLQAKCKRDHDWRKNNQCEQICKKKKCKPHQFNRTFSETQATFSSNKKKKKRFRIKKH